MSWSIQVATWTSNNRYPGVFRTVQHRIRQKFGPDLGSGRLRLLSFGCSTGNEIAALRSYFPDAMIFGCDVNRQALGEARRALQFDEAQIFESSPETIARHGPYDAIFAMSVFCRFPDSQDLGVEDFRSIYTFDAFEDGVARLAACLTETGILCLFNANYDVSHVAVAKDFVPIHSPLIGSNGFVDRFRRDGRRLTHCEMIGPHYVHRLTGTAADASDADFVTVIHERRPPPAAAAEARPASQVAWADPRNRAGIRGEAKQDAVGGPTASCVEAPPGRPDLFRFGPDLDECARQRLRATALGYWFEERGAGRQLTRAWFRSTFDGRIEQGPGWTVDIDPATEALLRAEVSQDDEGVGEAARNVEAGSVLDVLRGLARRTRAAGRGRRWGVRT